MPADRDTPGTRWTQISTTQYLIVYENGLSQPGRMRRRSRPDAPTGADRVRGRSDPGGCRDPSAHVSGRRTGGILCAREGNTVPDGVESIRHNGTGPVPLPRYARIVSQTGGFEGRSRRLHEAAVALLGHPLSRDASTSPVCAHGPRPGAYHPTVRSAAIEVLAAGRRCVRHTAAGLHGAFGSTWVETFQPRHVPRTAFRQRLHSRPRVGLHYQIHRGIGVHHAAAIRRGEALRGQRVRRRTAGPDAGGGHALAGGHAGAVVCRCAGRPSRPLGSAGRPLARPRRGRLCDRRLHRPGEHASRKDRSAITSVTTV